jgi:ATP synthase delta (OSCP) subunit
MKLKLPDTIASTQDVNALLVEVREYAKWFAHEEIKRRVSAKHTSEPPTISDGATQLFKQVSGHKQLTSADIDTIITTLQDYAAHAPSITITLAAPAPASLKKTLVGWCRDNIEPDILVSFQFNAGILGGLVVRRGSRVFDWSFRRQLLAASGTFPEVLRRV